MSDLERRPGTRLSRGQRERRVYSLMVTATVAGIVGAVTLVLAVFGVMGAGLPIVLLVVAAVCALLVRRTVGGERPRRGLRPRAGERAALGECPRAIATTPDDLLPCRERVEQIARLAG